MAKNFNNVLINVSNDIKQYVSIENKEYINE